jgi:SAM-dependent methyltransferase
MTNPTSSDSAFSGPMSEIYERFLVPMIFEPYAAELAARVVAAGPRRVLEVAAGTGVVTRAMASCLPESVSIIATDLNPAMLEQAAIVGTRRPVDWRQADAMQLPFDDGAFDAVVCQFGVMFFPDKAKAFSEARRVLAPGGALLFSVWDGIEENEFADVITSAMAGMFPDDPPRFMSRVPHGYSDRGTIGLDLARGGFTSAPEFATVTARSRAASPRLAALPFCLGTPLRHEIEARDARRLAEATDVATEAIARRFGRGAVDGKIQAQAVSVAR